MVSSISRAAAAAFGAWLVLGVGAVASAQEVPNSGVVVSSNSGTPLVVDGIDVDKLPLHVAAGAQVCAPGPRVYKTEGDRYIFQRWNSGSTDECIVASTRGAYRAMYAHEVLLIVKSTAPGVQRSMWVPYGTPIRLEVPDTVQDGDNTRFRFQAWSEGESPFDRVNTIAPVKPTTLEVNWVREHRLQVEGPEVAGLQGSGWYAEGTNLVLRAPETVPADTEQERWRFTGWESTSFPAAPLQNPQSALTMVKVDMPYNLRGKFEKQYLVHATSPVGTLKRDWITAGQEVVLEAPPVLDVLPEQERLIFKRWDGMDNLLSPRISGTADKPIIVSAAYERQAMLKVNAPHGVSGDGWHKVGNVASVSVPGSVPQALILKSSFLSFGGYPAGQSAVQVLVNEPTTLTALYRTEPDWLVLALLLGIPLVIVGVYFQYTRGWLTRLRTHAATRLQRLRARGLRPRGADSPAAAPRLTPTDISIHRNGSHVPEPVGQKQR